MQAITLPEGPQFNIGILFAQSLNVKQFFCHIYDISGVTTSGQSGPGSNCNERMLCISEKSRAEVSQSDCIMSYRGHSLGRSYPSIEMLLVHSTAPVDWADFKHCSH